MFSNVFTHAFINSAKESTMEKVFIHAFIKDNQLTLVFSEGDAATYRLADKHNDKYVCSYGTMTVMGGTVFLYNMEKNYHFKIRG